MLVRYDPFREIDRFTDQLFGNATARAPFIPMDAVRREDVVMAITRAMQTRRRYNFV